MRTIGFAVIATLAAASAASAFDPVAPADVAALAKKKVYVEYQVEVRWKEPFREGHLFVGQEVTVKGREERQIDAWCVVTDAAGNDWEVMVENLSTTPPAYSMLATGPLEEFLPRVAAAAIDLPLRIAEVYQANGYDQRIPEVMWLRAAYEKAHDAHVFLLRNLIHGRTSKSQVLRDEKNRWLWMADPSIMEAYCEGMPNLERWKQSDFMKKAEALEELVSAAAESKEAALTISRLKEELERKPWRSSLHMDAPPAQKDALDRAEIADREKKIAECGERIAASRGFVAKRRAELGL